MNKKSYLTSKIQKVPIDFVHKVDSVTELANLPRKLDAFAFIGSMQPIILSEKSIRLPKSKDLIKHIDVRYTFKIKNGVL